MLKFKMKIKTIGSKDELDMALNQLEYTKENYISIAKEEHEVNLNQDLSDEEFFKKLLELDITYDCLYTDINVHSVGSGTRAKSKIIVTGFAEDDCSFPEEVFEGIAKSAPDLYFIGEIKARWALRDEDNTETAFFAKLPLCSYHFSAEYKNKVLISKNSEREFMDRIVFKEIYNLNTGIRTKTCDGKPMDEHENDLSDEQKQRAIEEYLKNRNK